MKKLLAAILALVLAALPAAVRADVERGFGGTLQWPTFNGLQLGLSMPYVLLWEEFYNGATPTLDDDPRETSERDCYYRIGTIEFAGAPFEVFYWFRYNVFNGAICRAIFAEEEEAMAWYWAAVESFTALYGEGTEFDFPEMNDELSSFTWQERTSQLPYRVPTPESTRYGEMFNSEYIWPRAEVRCMPVEGEGYQATAYIMMEYCYSANAMFVETNGPLEGLDEEHEDRLLNNRYHDSRYYLGE